MRSFDERSHNYLGFSLVIRGCIDSVEREFSVGIGKAAQQKQQFSTGDEISGECLPVVDERMEPAEFYKASRLKKTDHTVNNPAAPPPWEDIPPDLEVYRGRGHRRLSAQTYVKKCSTCIWGCVCR